MNKHLMPFIFKYASDEKVDDETEVRLLPTDGGHNSDGINSF